MLQRGLTASDRPAVAALLESLAAFKAEERAVALELVDARLARPEGDDYRFILSFAEVSHSSGGRSSEKLAGYLCYGRTPMTMATYDLYWIATSPEFARSGVASDLLASMEREIGREGGGLVRVETGSREGHGAAVHFYDALGFRRAAVIGDFYAPGDDLLIFTKRVSGERVSSFQAPDDAALYDAAFSYRDYAAERDFFLACSRRFGERDVRRVLAWACGPARHLLAFAEMGIGGVGADGSDSMIAYAARVAGAERAVGTAFVRADLDERPEILPVDLSFVPLSAIHQLTTPEALEKHLRLAASLLSSGGVHVIEATHPADLTPSGVNRTEWTEVRGDSIVDARFRMHIDRTTAARVVPVSLDVVCTTKNGSSGNGSGAKVQRVLRQEGEWYIPDLEGWRSTIARVPELALAATLGDFNVHVPFEHSAAWRLILVLKRI
jgi:ribosomal protein S18 acetylase RimI-like enzyme